MISDVRLPLLAVHGVEVGLELGGLLLGPPPLLGVGEAGPRLDHGSPTHLDMLVEDVFPHELLSTATVAVLPPALEQEAAVRPVLMGQQPGELGVGFVALVTGEDLLAPVLHLLVAPHICPGLAGEGAVLEATDLDDNLILAAVLHLVLVQAVLLLESGGTLGTTPDPGLPGDLGAAPPPLGRGGVAEQDTVPAPHVLLQVEAGGEQHGAHVALDAWPPAPPGLVLSAGGKMQLQGGLALEDLATLLAGVAPAVVHDPGVAVQVLPAGERLATLGTDAGNSMAVLLVSPEPLLPPEGLVTLLAREQLLRPLLHTATSSSPLLHTALLHHLSHQTLQHVLHHLLHAPLPLLQQPIHHAPLPCLLPLLYHPVHHIPLLRLLPLLQQPVQHAPLPRLLPLAHKGSSSFSGSLGQAEINRGLKRNPSNIKIPEKTGI